MWFTFGVNSAWKAFLAKDKFWDIHSVHKTGPLVLDNTTEKDPPLKEQKLKSFSWYNNVWNN